MKCGYKVMSEFFSFKKQTHHNRVQRHWLCWLHISASKFPLNQVGFAEIQPQGQRHKPLSWLLGFKH